MTTHGDGAHEPRESPHDCELNRFERNRYFHQKPMFARDFVAEQTYHVDRQDTLARYLAGEGILHGLETTVVEEEDGRLTVTVDEGVALDCCGRLLVVPGESEWTLADPGGDETHLYLVYGECVTETIPLSGSESACETECEYNRVLEVVSVEHGDPPNEEQYKTIPEVEFPDPTTTTLEDREALFRMARTFHENGGTLHDCGPDDRRVFLGTFTGTEAGPWSRTTAPALGYAYSTDLLYAALANLFVETNPLGVGLEVEPAEGLEEGETGATVRVKGPENPEDEVTVLTADPDVTIAPDGTQRITVEVPGLDVLRNRLDSLDALLREQAMRYMRTAFSVVFERFAGTPVGSAAETVRETAVEGIGRAPPRYTTAEEFVDFIDDVVPEGQTLQQALAGHATPASIARYETAFQDLVTARGTADALRMTTALDGVSESAEWLLPIQDVDVVTVFLGDEDLDLTDLDVFGLPDGGEHTFVGVEGNAEGASVTVEDVGGADVTAADGFELGRYANSSDGPVVLAVVDPVVDSLGLRTEQGSDVTNGSFTDSRTLTVTAGWNFHEYEGVVVSVLQEDNDLTGELTGPDGVVLTESGRTLTLVNVDDLEPGTYTVRAAGEEHLDEASNSVTFTIEERVVDLQAGVEPSSIRLTPGNNTARLFGTVEGQGDSVRVYLVNPAGAFSGALNDSTMELELDGNQFDEVFNFSARTLSGDYTFLVVGAGPDEDFASDIGFSEAEPLPETGSVQQSVRAILQAYGGQGADDQVSRVNLEILPVFL